MTDTVVWQGKAPFSLSYSYPLPLHTSLKLKLLPELIRVQVLFALTSLWKVLNKSARAVLEARHRACLWMYSAPLIISLLLISYLLHISLTNFHLN